MSIHRELTSLKEGQFANVVSLSATGSMRRRLLDLGLVEGTQIQCVQISPFGDPTAYAIRGATIALRCEDASDILIQ